VFESAETLFHINGHRVLSETTAVKQKTERVEIENTTQYYAKLRSRMLASMILVPCIPFILVLITLVYYFSRSLEKNTTLRTR
jgi:nitrogen fixation/metabolism regulation signal transduction histidine kinase